MKLTLHEKILSEIFNRSASFVFFDIGACEGLSSVRYSRIFSRCIIYAFEPVPRNFLKLLKNRKKYKLEMLNPFQLALSSTRGTATFHLSSGQPHDKDQSDSIDYGNKSSSLFRPDKHTEIYPWLKFDQTILVNTDTLDHFCSALDIPEIHFIHLDVQGAELMVLKGGRKTLMKVKSIWLEVEKISLYEKQPLKDEVEAFLIEEGFVLILSTVNDVAGDQLWVKETYWKAVDFVTRLRIIYNKARFFFIRP